MKAFFEESKNINSIKKAIRRIFKKKRFSGVVRDFNPWPRPPAFIDETAEVDIDVWNNLRFGRPEFATGGFVLPSSRKLHDDCVDLPEMKIDIPWLIHDTLMHDLYVRSFYNILVDFNSFEKLSEYESLGNYFLTEC